MLFRSGGKSGSYRQAEQALRNLEGRIAAAIAALRQRIDGAPARIVRVLEDRLAASRVFAGLAEGYEAAAELRRKALAEISQIPLLAQAAQQALLVAPDPRLGPELPQGQALDPTNDRLAQEADLLKDASALASLDEAQREALRIRIGAFLDNWQQKRSAPLLIVAQAENMALDVLRGDVFAAIDLSAFRDQLEDAISALVPTSVKFTYDFRTVLNEPSTPAIFMPRPGSPFVISVDASVDLRSKKTDFAASALIGPFDIHLVAKLIEAIRFRFGGAAFSVRQGVNPRFDVIYEDFEILGDLEFAQALQDFLKPKDGGVFVQPMTRGAGLEVGYGLNLGTIGVGATSFSNVTLNVSAELPFGDSEALFKVSLGRRLAPFTMGVLPFMGSGYFSIYAQADGIRGFEASFEYGGGTAIGYGPLSAICRIQAGVFIRVLKVDGKNSTEIYGTFFAGGSASIWIFHFATSLYVRLGTDAGGAMYGEAIYSFSFSLGLADYDYSIQATRRETALGGGAGGANGGANAFLAHSDRVRVAQAGDLSAAILRPGLITHDVTGPTEDWDDYASYFDATLLEGLRP